MNMSTNLPPRAPTSSHLRVHLLLPDSLPVDNTQLVCSGATTSTRLRIGSWNLGHQLRTTSVSVEVLEVIRAHALDVVVLTEVMPPNSAHPLRDQFAALGMHMSAYSPGERVVIAARSPIEQGDLTACDLTSATRPNFRHVRMREWSLEIVGMRVPMFGGVPGAKRRYWEWFDGETTTWQARRLVAIGDFNADPRRARRLGGRSLHALTQRGWEVSDPPEPWSHPFKHPEGMPPTAGSRLDHALVSPHLSLRSAHYITAWQGCIIVQARKPRLADHALLVVEVET
jgi:endonuclease/exonuclease/phosphatase family metal-dependent hydrolase